VGGLAERSRAAWRSRRDPLMLGLLLGRPDTAPVRLLAIGAHPDDVEIGCSGTLLRLIGEGAIEEVCWVVLSGQADRAAEARASAAALLAGVAQRRIILRDFADGFFPYDGREIKSFFEELKRDFSPDVVLTHQRGDLHQDHRVSCELTWNTFRDHLILEYEVPKYDGDVGQPNLFVPLDESLCQRKIAHLMTHFASQVSKRWFKEDLFSGLLRLRGMECNSPSTYAEAFYCRKAVLA
jgi:LmbE family N-acetylglucosaminyl deacetylase